MRPLSIFVLIILLTGCDMIRDQLDGNQSPAIDTFDAEPLEGEAPLTTSFFWTIADIEGDSITCTLDFGDGATAEILDCDQVSNAFHEFVTPGGYVAVLTATDGTTQVSRSVGVRVLSVPEDNPSDHFL